MKVTNDIKYIGVNGHRIDLFEGQYIVPNGMAYNSYIILDEKIAVLDTVDKNFKDEWLNNIKNIVKDRKVDYLVIHHMEPDHSSNIMSFINAFPTAKIVASTKAFQMMKNFFNEDFVNNRIVVNEGDKLLLGIHTLTFYVATMVHWPEVIVSYDEKDKVLFSADAFGKFGALDIEEEWTCEARRYYFGIVGKYGLQVQILLKKLITLDIKIICSLHGPILNSNLEYYINLYNIWSNYEVEEEGVVIAYTSMYGNTEEAVMILKDKLIKEGCKKVVVNDLARCDMAEAVEDAFRYSKLVLATTTYNANIFPTMRTFISHLIERNYQNRIIGFIENGSWAPVAAKVMKDMFEKSKNITYTNTIVKILSKINNESFIQLDNLAKELL